MHIIKRDGSKEAMKFDKIGTRIRQQCNGLDRSAINPVNIAQMIISSLRDGITSHEIDTLISETCHSMTTRHPDFDTLALRIAISRLHKEAPMSFFEAMEILYQNTDTRGNFAPLISDSVLAIAKTRSKEIDAHIQDDRDYRYTYFGFKTLEKSYLQRSKGKIVETPQYMLMRVALGIHGEDLESAFKTYDDMSQGYYTHATPTLFNSGTRRPQNSSCFLLTMEDSLEGIYKVLSDCAMISKNAGGIGLNVSSIRASNSYIRGTGGKGNGLVPMLQVFNSTSRYVDQGGKRKGSIAVYLEPWHADVEAFIDLKRPHGAEEDRARDLFPALWIPDLFMQRAKADEMWSLFCPDECTGLTEVFDEAPGGEFTQLYERYEREGKARKQIPARDLIVRICTAQIESGTPYILYKDAANRKSNQKNAGLIRQSNLCTEILEITTPEEHAVCNLASIALPSYFNSKTGVYDFDTLGEKVRHVVKSLNRVIDVNFYPVKETRTSNMRHRPIGIGYQGLADLFALAKTPFDSPLARKLNRDIAEAVYYYAVSASADLAEVEGPYETFHGSPISKGLFQFDLWGVQPSPRYDWEALRERVMRVGVRNSLLIAPMPTASTSQILGNNECFEPFTSNVYSRSVGAGTYIVLNKHLVRDLRELGLWDEAMSRKLMAEKGSIQAITEIPEHIRAIYRTVWEISQKSIIEMAADRGAFVCQSQSMNLFVPNPNTAKITSMMFYAWEHGLKTGSYYIRVPNARDAVSFTVVPPTKSAPVEEEGAEGVACSLDNPEACDMCSG
jgi:ribonucleoside-diphosphate reductase alpha chain